MKQTYLVATVLFLWNCTDLAISATPSQATRDLWTGIMQSKPRLVHNAIQRGANLSTRVGQYEDPPLTAAMRIYGNSMISKIKGTGKDFGRRITNSLMGSTLLSALAYLISEKSPTMAVYAWLVSFPMLISVPRDLWFGIPAEAKVIEVLLQNLPPEDAQHRNKEGLNALEVLGAFHPYAYELQDQLWERIMNHLIQMSTDNTITYDPMNDIAADLNNLGS
nr:hypothetical protein [Candidatus Babeliales bacterium]